MNTYLVPLDVLYKTALKNNLMQYVLSFDYATKKDKKYVVTLISGKKVSFGCLHMEDYLIHKDEKRRDNFLKRFGPLFKRFENNPEQPIFWAYLLLW